MQTRTSLNLFTTMYPPTFWHEHHLLPGTQPHDIVFEKKLGLKAAAHSPDAQGTQSTRGLDADQLRNRLLAHISTYEAGKSPGHLLIASTNLARLNRALSPPSPVRESHLFDTPKGALVPQTLASFLAGIEATSEEKAQDINYEANVPTTRQSASQTMTGVVDHIMDQFDSDLSRLKTKYEALKTWSQTAVVFATYAQGRNGSGSPLTTNERHDLRLLRTQLQRSAQSAKGDLAGFEALYQQAAPTAMALTATANRPVSRAPMLVPNLLTGGQIQVAGAYRQNLFAEMFEEFFDGIDDLRLAFVGPRLAELNDAQTRLGDALRRGNVR